MKRIGQIRKSLLTIGCLAIMLGNVSGVIEKCRDIYGQYPYFFMLPVYLGKAEVEKPETHTFKTSGDCFRNINITTEFTFERPAFGK